MHLDTGHTSGEKLYRAYMNFMAQRQQSDSASSAPTTPFAMNPHISIPRQHGSTSNFGGTTPTARSNGLRTPRFFKRFDYLPNASIETGKAAAE
ncbi:MAG: hypothetical protein Q9169_001567 [Polycauliona sp. 2 TL-2023]